MHRGCLPRKREAISTPLAFKYMIHGQIVICKSREQSWQEMRSRVTHMKDKLGKEVDPGIAETVVVLNLLSIPTTQSCEGHLDHGTGAPWIDIEDTNISERSNEVNRLFQHALQLQRQQVQITEETVRLFEEAHQAKQDVKRLHLAIRQKLLNYLASFYEQRQVPFDVRLVIQSRDTTGRSRLESQGADFQETASLEIRRLKLTVYQEEMRRFTVFLKQQYFQEADAKGGR